MKKKLFLANIENSVSFKIEIGKLKYTTKIIGEDYNGLLYKAKLFIRNIELTEFSISLTEFLPRWTIQDTLKQWREALERLRDHNFSFLVKSFKDCADHCQSVSIVEVIAIYKEEDSDFLFVNDEITIDKSYFKNKEKIISPENWKNFFDPINKKKYPSIESSITILNYGYNSFKYEPDYKHIIERRSKEVLAMDGKLNGVFNSKNGLKLAFLDYDTDCKKLFLEDLIKNKENDFEKKFSIFFEKSESEELEDTDDFFIHKVMINNFYEIKCSRTKYWSKQDYFDQWKEGLERIKTHDKSCIVSSVENLEEAPFILLWLFYKEGKKVVIQKQLLFDQVYFKTIGKKAFTKNNCYDFIPDRIKIGEDDVYKPLEWIVDLESF